MRPALRLASCVSGGDGGDDSSDMSDEGLDGMSNLSSEDDGLMYLMDGQVMLVNTHTEFPVQYGGDRSISIPVHVYTDCQRAATLLVRRLSAMTTGKQTAAARVMVASMGAWIPSCMQDGVAILARIGIESRHCWRHLSCLNNQVGL